MAIKKIPFNIDVNRAYPPCDTLEEVKEVLGIDGGTGEIAHHFKVFDFDYDPAETNFLSLQLNAAGDALVDAHAGKSDEERIALNLAENEAIVFAEMNEDKRRQIKAEAQSQLEEINWEIERAQETDLLNGNNVAMTANANKKKTIRDLNNQQEAALDAITTNDLTAMKDFKPDDFGSTL